MTAPKLPRLSQFDWHNAPPAPPRVTPPPAKSKKATCEWCGAEFDRTQPEQKFCKRKHATKASEKRRRLEAVGTSGMVSAEMIKAARSAGDRAGIGDPYGANIRDFIRDDGSLDRDALHAADADAEEANLKAWGEVLEAAMRARYKRNAG